MKVLVTYYSETGNTEKVARAIHEGIEETIAQKSLLPVGEVKDPSAYDLVFVGFPVMGHTVPPKAAHLLKSLPKGTKVAIFATHGSLRGGTLAKSAFEYASTLPAGEVLGSLGVRGKVRQSVIDAALKNSENKPWGEEAASAVTHPNEADFADARAFADNMLTRARG